ncbi:protein BRANCHLESS TRICHOME [Malania oleifera]|uniref:protein BRANCHLESS TRICHOME n=1 Tax=Malania oleifera TaxID=397392 RepID=UPI0025AE2AE9|nr:protein BRANCHLESS TRICHOME [Malania oleifera]
MGLLQIAALTGKIRLEKAREKKKRGREGESKPTKKKRQTQKPEEEEREHTDETTVMMTIITRSPENNPGNKNIVSEDPITTSTCPSWKLYENPFYYYSQCSIGTNNIKRLRRLPRGISASFWDLTFFMDSELDLARTQIVELRAELELERRARKKLESLNKRLARELCEERRGREALERVCEELAKEVSTDKAQIGRMKREIEEEREMLRTAEVLREERVQMKLADAKFFFEEKLLELEASKSSISKMERRIDQEDNVNVSASASSSGFSRESPIQRRVSTEAENPHIKRGIKGFVEFPRVVRAIGSKSRPWGAKLECQKAQLRILLMKQRNQIRSNNLIMS